MPSSFLGDPYIVHFDKESSNGGSVALADWSAQDFADIYVRFRPHLVSYAQNFLRIESQAEEVVQDAFLYLMTSLPELDSEIGVLRFLKWKTKMLCLDIIRSSKVLDTAVSLPVDEDIVDPSQPSDVIERADDAAIIRLAMAKLSPRHRAALVATIYEGKPASEVASNMGLDQNAFRQLIFRARKSFREALVGEAKTSGLTVAQILSIAAKRNASTAVRVTSAATATLALFVGALLVDTNSLEESPNALVVKNEAHSRLATQEVKPPPSVSEIRIQTKASQVATAQIRLSEQMEPLEGASSPTPGTREAHASEAVGEERLEPDSVGDSLNLQLLTEFAFNSALDATLAPNSSTELVSRADWTIDGNQCFIRIANDRGFISAIAIDTSDPLSLNVGFGGFEVSHAGNSFVGVSTDSSVDNAFRSVDESRFETTVLLRDFVVGDSSSNLGRNVLSPKDFQQLELRFLLTFEKQGAEYALVEVIQS